MSEHTPHNWIIVEITNKGETVRKVIGGWSGGYLDGDRWRISSGIEKIEEDGDYYTITNHSGSIYNCHKRGQGASIPMSEVLNKLEKACRDNEDVSYEIIKHGE